MFSMATAVVLGWAVAATWNKVDIVISLSAVSSCVLVFPKHYWRYTSSLYLKRHTLRSSRSLVNCMDFSQSERRFC